MKITEVSENMPTCHLLPYNVYDSHKNMDIDCKMALVCDKRSAHTMLRFYGWSSPTLSLGYAQKLRGDINIDYCKNNNIDIIRRPTGGRAVLHENEITYCIASSLDNRLFSKSILESYKNVNTAIASGLRRLGIDADLYKAKDRPVERSPVCFASFSPYEILVNGKKIAGSAQRRFKNSFIQHGSLLIDIDREKLSNIFNNQDTNNSSPPFEKMTSLKEEGAKELETDNIVKALIHGFIEVFDFSISSYPF